MCNKIKKQIKRSAPLFVIFNLIASTMAAGLVFNLEFEIKSTISKIKNLEFSIYAPTVEASDTASTTVTVRNAPPEITSQAAEVPASTANTPINVGSGIDFTITADDKENNSYYLIVCSSNSVIASTTGGPPTCAQTTFCVSALTNDTQPATCNYGNVVDPGAETDDWWAYACDNHPTEGECTETGDPGAGDSGSPFYVNHAPSFTAIATIDNNKDPGGTFTIRASATDADVARGAEVLHVYACSTNSWATSTGCAAMEFCHATSTSPDIDCSFATGTPAVDGDYIYYAFVMDNFYMPAPQNSRNTTYHVNNVAPQITNVKINGDADIEINLKDSAFGDAIATTSSVSVTDYNGCTDYSHATGTIYWSGVANANYCTDNDNNCYQIASGNCAVVAGSCQDSGDALFSLICSTTIAFFALPTDDSANNPYEPDTWLGAITVFDEALSATATSAAGVDLKTNTGSEVTEVEIPYGIIQAGRNSGTSTATTTIVNYGNSPINVYVYGQDMTGPSTISITNQKHDLTAYFNYNLTGTNATSTLPGDLENTDIARPTSLSIVYDHIYWGIGIPPGTQSGDYEGVNTFTAWLDGSGVGW